MIYAYAALKSGVGFANGAPNLTVESCPAEQGEEKSVPVCGKDFKTGQTLMKTILALAQGKDARAARLVFTNILEIVMVRSSMIPGRSRRRRSRSFQCWNTYFSPRSTLSSIRISPTLCGSTTIRHEATNKEDGQHRHLRVAGRLMRSRSIFLPRFDFAAPIVLDLALL
jgi:hypothetical protein